MGSILRMYFDLCLFRASPDSVPSSSVLFLLTLITYVVSGILLVVPTMSFGSAAGQSVLDTLVLLTVIIIALIIFGHQQRFQQTATAMTGTGTLLNVLAMPLVIIASNLSAAENGLQITSLFLLAFMVWSLLIFSHIMRAALGSSRGLSMALSVTYFMTSVMLNELVFPSAA